MILTRIGQVFLGVDHNIYDLLIGIGGGDVVNKEDYETSIGNWSSSP
jgi:hypothetical protein